MKLKVIETMLEYLGVHTVIIVVSLSCLLPFKVEEQKLAVTDFLPITTGRQDLTHHARIISSP
jgi:hypothetical protein